MNEIKFEVGDQVWAFSRQEWGEVREIGHQGMVMVVFGPHNFGWFEPSTLFFEEIVIPESARIRPTPKYVFKPGEPVCVRSGGIWHCRVFVSINEKGRFICRSSADPTSDLGTWLECEPYDQTLLGFDANEGENNE